MSDEAKLIDRALEGDADAFEQLVVQHQDRLFASMFQVTRSAEEAEDVVQEAFVRAYLKLDTFQRNSRFFTWLYRIAFNSALSRRRKKRANLSLDQTREVLGSEPTDDVEAPDERLLRGERVDLVRAALDRLSAEHRTILVRRMLSPQFQSIGEPLTDAAEANGEETRIENREEVEQLLERLDPKEAKVVRLYHLEGKSYDEISRSEGMPVNSIGPILSRARAKLKQVK